MSTPPRPGKGLSVRVDTQLYDDLAVLMRPGMKASDAVKYAVSILAASYRYAWTSSRVPDGVAPVVGGCYLRRPTPDEARNTPVRHASYTRPTRRVSATPESG